MSYLKYDKKNLINLDHSLNKEILRSNRAGAYASYSLVGCNTRKYHGLLVCPIASFKNELHVLLSSLDLSVVYNSSEFNLGIHKYQGDVYIPSGHKYIQSFEADETPIVVYRIGGVKIQRECLLVEEEQQIIIKYSVLEADKPIKLKFTPFLAFRGIHKLSKSNMYAKSKIGYLDNGVSACLYDGFPKLNMQFSKTAEFIQIPDWYYNIEYSNEQRRGYNYKEDLFVPGYFETEVTEGESLYFSASTAEENSKTFAEKFNRGAKTRIPRDSFKNCLLNSAEQFILKSNELTDIKAGYHWKEISGRDTFISLPGLCLTSDSNGVDAFFNVVDSQILTLKNGLFLTQSKEGRYIYSSADSSLWFIWSLQQYIAKYGEAKMIWSTYGRTIKKILTSFSTGKSPYVQMLKNGLLHTGEIGMALTWMDAIYAGRPITPRIGAVVEINALWYNAICFGLELANKFKDLAFIRKWKKHTQLISNSFKDVFWDEEKGYLADYAGDNKTNWSIRPNQIIAASMIHSPLTTEMKKSIVETIKQHLLTTRGIRSLAPEDALYKGVYQGNQEQRDHAYHQGSAWPWLLQHYCDAYLQVYKESGIEHFKKIISDFEPAMHEHGLGSISEIYDGNPPHAPKGAISQATSVASLLRIIDVIETNQTT